MQTYFDQVDRVRFAGPKTDNPLAFRHYNPDEIVLGKRMADHLRFAACYWHNFCWNGADMFGAGSFERPWQAAGDALEMAKRKADVAFEFFYKLNVPYYCFHDVDVSPEGASLKEYLHNFAIMTEVLAEKQQQTGVKQEREQIGRFLQMVVEHKHKIGFGGTLLIEPKPQEPTKHQYDYDVATVYGFLKQFGLENEIKVNIEANHATLAGHSFHHEIASAIALGIFGSVDANRGDAQLGWDTDQFPNSVEENTLVMYEILKAGGFTTGGLNFDAKVRRQSTDKYDMFYGHIGAMDVMALSLKLAARMIEDGKLDQGLTKRYAGWQGELGQKIMSGQMSLDNIARYAEQHNLNPQPQSGRQELLENLVNTYIFG
ncbi:MAG: xylose isomerase [Klebsiella pneumoniae]|nr:xylose isomerase [Klebsiella pneumoniae]